MPKKHLAAVPIPDGYAPLAGSERHPSANAKLLGPADPNETFSVTIVLRRRPDGPPIPGFDHFTTTSLRQRRCGTQDDFASKYGALPADTAKVVDFARGRNLRVVETNAGRRTVVVSGTVAAMSHAFAVALGRYQHEVAASPRKPPRTEVYRGRDGLIHVPTDLAEIIVGVFGLDNRTITHRNGGPGDPPVTTPLSVTTVTQYYGFPASSAAGQTIGIASPLGGYGGYLVSDVETTIGTSRVVTPVSAVPNVGNGSAQAVTSALVPTGQSVFPMTSTVGINVDDLVFTFGVPFATPSNMYTTVTAVTPSSVTMSYPVTADVPAGTSIFFNMDDETTQDICIAALAAPEAGIAVYFSTGDENGWIALLGRAAQPNTGDPVCSVVTSSFYFAGGDDASTLAAWRITDGFLDAVHETLVDAALQPRGVTICIASGDYGTSCNVGDDEVHVQYPASDPYVLAVGGTTLGSNVSNPPPYVEYVWNDASAAPYNWGTTGGGVSAFFARPSYQDGAGVPTSLNPQYATFAGRGVPDVAANASYNSGYSGLTFMGQSTYIGNGTSASSPLWAGLIALINAALGVNVGFVNPQIYALGASVFQPNIDATAGPSDNSNGGVTGYPATRPGWNACIGWGSPNGTALWNGLQAGSQQDLYVVLEQAVFGKDAIDDELAASSSATFDPALFVVIDGFTPSQLGINTVNLSSPPTQPQFSPSPPAGMSFVLDQVEPEDMSLLSTSPGMPQRFTYVYKAVFTSTAAFPATVNVTATVTAPVNSVSVSVSAGAPIELDAGGSPYFAGGSGMSWLSNDVRVFQIEPTGGAWMLPDPPYLPLSTGVTLGNTGDPTTDATTFIQQVIQKFNSWTTTPHLFDLISTDENASALDLLPTDPATNNNPVYNFAVARVRYNASSTNAQAVRVFFRLFQAPSTTSSYDPTTTYRRWSDGTEYGQAIPLVGMEPSANDPSINDIVTIPFFATPRVDVTQLSMIAQTDPPNVQPINANAGGEVDAYFGCWLDINQTGISYPSNLAQLPASVPAGAAVDGPYPASSLQTIQTIVANLHQCLLAEIAFDPDPIPDGYAPSASGPLAQRNLTLVDAANPGEIGSRRVPSTFTVRPTATALPSPCALPDELMIDWGNTPAGSVASIYWPAANAADVLAAAKQTYATPGWTISDPHTLRIPIAGGITYVPIPAGVGATFRGLITVDLPFGIRKGQVFTIVVRQVGDGPKAREECARRTGRRVVGSFQISVPVSTKAVMLAPEERALSVMRWVQSRTPASSPWVAVLDRYVQQIAERVRGLGGDPAHVLPSPSGGGAKPPTPPHPQHAPLEFTGKVAGLTYDRFGDFEGFLLHTEQAEERRFDSREQEIEHLVDRAWTERLVISVLASHAAPHVPASIVLRRAPRPARR